MEARLVGRNALLIECAGHAQVAATYAMLAEHRDRWGVVDLVPAARTVLVDGLPDAEVVRAELREWEAPEGAPVAPGAEVVIPVTYDGADLDEVARQWDLSTSEVVGVHTTTVFTVAFCGFAPGFAYCTGLPAGRTVGRRTDPRTSVPAGSVALAGEYTGVYPTSSPGGWQLIGRTATPLWDPGSTEPALLVPGTVVRFIDD